MVTRLASPADQNPGNPDRQRLRIPFFWESPTKEGAMRSRTSGRARLVLVPLLLLGVALLIGATSARSGVGGTYTVHNLSSNVPGLAAHTDPDLQNGRGITEPTSGPWWLADHGTEKSTLYPRDGTQPARTFEV